MSLYNEHINYWVKKMPELVSDYAHFENSFHKFLAYASLEKRRNRRAAYLYVAHQYRIGCNKIIETVDQAGFLKDFLIRLHLRRTMLRMLEKDGSQ